MDSHSSRWIYAGVVIGLGVGVLVWRAAIDEGPRPSAPRSVAESRPPAPEPGDAKPEAERIVPADPIRPHPFAPEPARELVPAGLFSPALLAYFEERFIEEWTVRRGAAPEPEVVAAGRERFEQEVRDLPTSIAREMAEEADRRDALLRALQDVDGLAMLQAAQEGVWIPTAEELDAQRFEKILVARSAGPSVEGATFANEKKSRLGTGITLTFGPGKHVLDERRLRPPRGEPWPEDVTLVGAGIDATLLRLGDLSPPGDVARLHVRDLTIDCGNQGFLDHRRGHITFDLERVRIVRFDSGAGGSILFDVQRGGTLLRARHCEFLATFGRGPVGHLFRSGPFVARFEHCLLDHVELELRRLGPNGLIVFDGCSFKNFASDPHVAAGERAVFRECDVAPLLSGEAYRTLPKRDLGELFP